MKYGDYNNIDFSPHFLEVSKTKRESVDIDIVTGTHTHIATEKNTNDCYQTLETFIN